MTQPNPTTTDDLAALKTRVQDLTATNETALAAIAAQGIQLGGASTFILGIRHDALIAHLYGDTDDPRHLAYELRAQQKFAETIAEVEGKIAEAQAQAAAAAARAKLLEGVNGATLPPRPGAGR